MNKLLEDQNRLLKSRRRYSTQPPRQEIQTNSKNGGLGSRAAQRVMNKPSPIPAAAKPSRQIGDKGIITCLRGWFFFNKEVANLLYSQDVKIKHTFRSLASKLTIEEQRAFHKKKSQATERFVINPAQNEGLNYAYGGDVERTKDARKKLLGHSCDECEAVSYLETCVCLVGHPKPLSVHSTLPLLAI